MQAVNPEPGLHQSFASMPAFLVFGNTACTKSLAFAHQQQASTNPERCIWLAFGTVCQWQQSYLHEALHMQRCWLYAIGSRYSPNTAGQPKGCPLRHLGCLFNQRRMYVNLQSADGLAANHYTMEDTGRWRELTVHPHDLPGAPGTRFDLRVSVRSYLYVTYLLLTHLFWQPYRSSAATELHLLLHS